MDEPLPEFLRIPQARRTLAWEEFLARGRAVQEAAPEPDRRAERRKTQQETRIAKLKAGVRRKELWEVGALATMPLQGKAAMAAIRAAQKGRRK